MQYLPESTPHLSNHPRCGNDLHQYATDRMAVIFGKFHVPVCPDPMLSGCRCCYTRWIRWIHDNRTLSMAFQAMIRSYGIRQDTLVALQEGVARRCCHPSGSTFSLYLRGYQHLLTTPSCVATSVPWRILSVIISFLCQRIRPSAKWISTPAIPLQLGLNFKTRTTKRCILVLEIARCRFTFSEPL